MKCQIPTCWKKARYAADEYFGEDVLTVHLCGGCKAYYEGKGKIGNPVPIYKKRPRKNKQRKNPRRGAVHLKSRLIPGVSICNKGGVLLTSDTTMITCRICRGMHFRFPYK